MIQKAVILGALNRDCLKRVLDDQGINGVDRRNMDAMRSVLKANHRVTAQAMLGSLRLPDCGSFVMKSVCQRWAIGTSLCIAF